MHLVRENQPTLRVQSLPPLPAHSLDHPCAQGCSEQPNHDEQYFYEKKSGYSHSVLSPSPLLPPPPPSHSHSPSLPLSRQMHLQFICEIVHAISDMVGIRQLPGEGHAWPGVFQHTQQVTLIHVLLNKQQRVVPVIKRIILYVSFGFPSVTFLIRWAVELP